MGPLLVIAAIVVVEILDWALLGYVPFDLHDPRPEAASMAMFAMVIYALYRFGWWGGVPAALVMTLYRLYYLSSPGEGFHFTPESLLRFCTVLLVTPVVLWLVGRLRAGARRAAYADAQAAAAERAAADLEQMVAARTADLASALARLRDVDRMKTDLVNAVSHELRTPLTSIRAYAEFLEDDLAGGLAPEQREFVRQIQLGASRLGRMVDDLLDFARLEAGTFKLAPQVRDLAPLTRSVVDSMRPLAQERGVTLALQMPPGSFVARVDAGRIEQVLINLLSNAIKFTDAGGHVSVLASRAPGELRFCVDDDGIGIAPEHLARVFEKFYQVDASATRERGGAGLGLAISRALIEAHGGTLMATSEPGRGSAFAFTLPAGEWPATGPLRSLEACDSMAPCRRTADSPSRL